MTIKFNQDYDILVQYKRADGSKVRVQFTIGRPPRVKQALLVPAANPPLYAFSVTILARFTEVRWKARTKPTPARQIAAATKNGSPL
jgi:hypothetical protein